MREMARWCVFVALWGSLSFSCRVEGGLHVVVEGTLIAGLDFDRLTLEVFKDGETAALSLETIPADGFSGFPHTVNILSGKKVSAQSKVHLRLTAWLGDAVMASVEESSTLASGDGSQLKLLLSSTADPGVRFVSRPQTVYAGMCSSEFAFELYAVGSSGADAQTNIQLAASSSSIISFYSDEDCTQRINNLVVQKGKWGSQFYVKASAAGTWWLGAKSPEARPSGRQALQVMDIPAQTVIFRKPALSVASDECSPPVTLELTDAQAKPSVPSAPVTVNLISNHPQVTVFSDASCTTPTTALQLTSSEPVGTFYFRGTRSGEAVIEARASGYAASFLQHDILPVVRTGDCRFPAGARDAWCTVTPPQKSVSKSILFFQTQSLDESPAATFIDCRLHSVDAVYCQRHSPAGPATISWQTVERPFLKVQHVPFECHDSLEKDVSLFPVLNKAETFVLMSHTAGVDVLQSGSFATRRLMSTDQVRIEFGTPCQHVAGTLQVVEWPQSRVERLRLTPTGGWVVQAVANLPAADVSRSFLLYSYSALETPNGICAAALRGAIRSPVEVAVTRGSDNEKCGLTSGQNTLQYIDIERVELPSVRVFQSATEFKTGELSLSVPLPGMRVERTVAFTGAQAAFGHGWGESALSDSLDVAEVQAVCRVKGSDALELKRERASAPARFNTFVVGL